MTARPKLLITRRLPEAVTKRVSAQYDVELNADDHVMSPDELLTRAQGKDALLVTPVDKITPELVEKLKQLGTLPFPNEELTPEAHARLFAADLPRVAKLIESSGIKASEAK